MNFKVIILFLIMLFAGCGGGTSGSGIKTYEGRVRTSDGISLINATVTIETTGDSSRTDQSGIFRMQSEVDGEDVPFLIETENLSARFMVKNSSEESSRIQLDVIVDSKTSKVEAREIELDVWFAGLCDYYFENRDIIRQSNRVPPGTVCSLNVSLRGDGNLLADTPLMLQYAGCEGRSEWRNLQLARTGTGRHTGFAEINFEFIDSAEYCRYRVVAPYGADAYQTVVFPIDTFTEQEFYGR